MIMITFEDETLILERQDIKVCHDYVGISY